MLMQICSSSQESGSKLRKNISKNMENSSDKSLKTIITFFIEEKKKLIQIDDANNNSWIEIMLFADGYLMTS